MRLATARFLLVIAQVRRVPATLAPTAARFTDDL